MKRSILLWSVSITALVGLACGYQELTHNEINHLGKEKHIQLLDPANKKGYLQPILKVRVPGSDGSKEVQEHFHQFFHSLNNWNIDSETFSMDTPKGPTNFTNFLAIRDPPGVEKRLTLVAHYDSKIEPEGFIGAIDSAFSCALIMYVVKQLDEALTSKWKEESKLGLQVLFLDGEEAVEEWTDEDSIYGARYLASKWEKESKLDSIDMFILLDLLGASDPNMMSFYESTDWAHKNMKNVEKKLRKQKITKFKRTEKSWFVRPGRFFAGGMLGDDHIPFLERGVPTFHLIPYPFPDTWHQVTDDANHLDSDTMHDWALIMTAFTAEYLELTGHLGVENTDL